MSVGDTPNPQNALIGMTSKMWGWTLGWNRGWVSSIYMIQTCSTQLFGTWKKDNYDNNDHRDGFLRGDCPFTPNRIKPLLEDFRFGRTSTPKVIQNYRGQQGRMLIMVTMSTRLMILGVNRQIDGKVDGAVEDQEEVGDLGHQVDDVRFQVFDSVAWKQCLWFNICFQVFNHQAKV